MGRRRRPAQPVDTHDLPDLVAAATRWAKCSPEPVCRHDRIAAPGQRKHYAAARDQPAASQPSLTGNAPQLHSDPRSRSAGRAVLSARDVGSRRNGSTGRRRQLGQGSGLSSTPQAPRWRHGQTRLRRSWPEGDGSPRRGRRPPRCPCNRRARLLIGRPGDRRPRGRLLRSDGSDHGPALIDLDL